jgi:hypothetical protein
MKGPGNYQPGSEFKVSIQAIHMDSLTRNNPRFKLWKLCFQEEQKSKTKSQ